MVIIVLEVKKGGDVVADGVVKVLNGIEYFGQGFSKFAIRFFQL